MYLLSLSNHISSYITNLKEGAGEDWAGQFKLYEDRCLIEKSPKCFDSDENFGAEKPIGSEKIIFYH